MKLKSRKLNKSALSQCCRGEVAEQTKLSQPGTGEREQGGGERERNRQARRSHVSKQLENCSTVQGLSQNFTKSNRPCTKQGRLNKHHSVAQISSLVQINSLLQINSFVQINQLQPHIQLGITIFFHFILNLIWQV